MSGTHALSGAVVWLSVCAAAGPVAGLHPTWVQASAGAVIAAGAAIWPDVDHPSSRAARALGPLSRVAARIVSYVSDKIRDATCGCCATDGTHGHRTLTHTMLFAAATGAGVCAAGWWWGIPAVAIVVAIATGLGVLGLAGKHTGRIGAILAGAAAGVAVWHLAPEMGWWWLGAPITLGVLCHLAGDAVTHHGIPALWPIRIAGCRWRRVGTPKWMRFRTGGPVETLIGVLLLAGGGAAGWLLITG